MRLITAILSVLVMSTSTTAMAQHVTLPSPIRLIVPFSPGGSTDIVARAVAAGLSKRIGVTVVVENRPGASTFIAAAAVAHGPKDGSMLFITSSSTFTAAATNSNVQVDVLADLAPVAMLSDGPLVIVSSTKNDLKTPSDLVAAAKARPDMITHGTAGIGTITDIAGELLNDAAGIRLRAIPYKGSGPALNDVVAGRVDLMFAVYQGVAAQVEAGGVRLLAVTTREPSPAFPGVPAMASAVPGFGVDYWVGFFTTAGSPPAVIQKLNHELNETVRSKSIQDMLSQDGFVSPNLSIEQFSTRIRSDMATWKKVAKEKNIVVN